MSRKSQILAILKISAFAGLIAVTSFAIFGLSGCGGGGSSTKSVSVSAAATTVDPTDSTTLSATVSNDSKSEGVTWSVSGGGALSNQTTASATFTAPAATNAAQSATITATSVADNTKSATATITIPAAVSVTTAALPSGIEGAAYSQPLAASGGIPPYSWTITGGTLPTCLNMNSAGVISGTPVLSCVGNATGLTFKVTDSGTATPLTATSAPLSLNIAFAPAIQFLNPGVLPNAIIGTPYNTSVAANGGAGALSYSISLGALPPGLSINAAGSVVGMATTPGSYNFTVKAADAFGDFQNQIYTIGVNYPALIVIPGNEQSSQQLPNAFTGTAYSQTLNAGGGSGAGYVWTVLGLPANGLSYSANGGTLTISGTPTNPAGVLFSVGVKDGVGNSSVLYSYAIAVFNPISLPAANPPSLPANTSTNAPYSGTITASGGNGSGYTWTVTGLSDGLTSSNTGGVLTISGTPTTTGTVTFQVSVKDGSGSSTGPITYTITVNNVLSLPATNPTTLPGNAITGTTYSGTLSAGGGSGTGYVFTVTGLPSDGLSSSATGGTLTISGTPTAASTITFQVSVKDSLGNTTGPITYTINVYDPLVLPATIPATLPSTGTQNVPYSGTIVATGGSGSGYTFTVTGLFDGLISSSSGATLTISGSPGAPDTVTVQVSVKDSVGNSAGPFTYTINVYTALILPAPNPYTLGSGVVSAAYSGFVSAIGGSGSGYVWTVTGLSDGLTYSTNGATLNITGTPTSATTVSFNASVKDNAGNSAGPIAYTIPVYTVLTLPAPNPGTLPSTGTVNIPYTGTLVAAGGSGSGYTWTVTGLSDGLTSSNTGATLTISGTPTSASTVTFMASVKDSVGNTAGPLTYTVNVYAGLTLPTPNPASLPSGIINTAYSGTVSVGGGSGSGYVWTVTGFPANGLNYTTNGATLTVTGTPTSLATVTFHASVQDSLNNTTGPITYTIPVYTALTLPAPNPGTLPTNVLSGSAYTGTIVATGGSGSGYVFTVTGLSDGLNYSSSGGTLTISGTPASAATVSFNVSVNDSANNSAGPLTYSLTVYDPTSLPGSNPPTLPSATINQLYQGSIIGNGGVAPYTWLVNGTAVPNNGTPVALNAGQGLTVSANGTNILSFGGTPTAVADVPFKVKLTDSIGNGVGPVDYDIQINAAGSQVKGQFNYVNSCDNSSFPPTFTVTINTTPPQQTTTDNLGTYKFQGVPNGTYIITPSIAGPSSVFLPATQTNVVVNNSSVNGVNFDFALGYTVSGNVSYSGARTGQVYLSLQNTNCGGNASLGTSIPFASLGSGGAFTIHGVPSGTYNLNGSIDNLGFGASNATNPTGHTPNLTVSNANLSGVVISLTDPTLAVPSSAPKFNSISPTDLGAVIQFKAITDNNIEAVTDYQLQWSTDSTFATGINFETFKAIGTGSNVWFLNNSTAGISGSFVNGTAYYFRMRGELSAGNSPWAVFGGGTPTAVTIGAPTTGNTVTGTVTIPAGITPTGPLYAGFYDPNSGAVYAERIASPVVGANFYSVLVPTSTDAYVNFGVLDQNNDAIVDNGDVSNTDDSGSNPNGIVINSNLSNQDETLPAVNSTATVQTQFFSNTNQGGTFTSYQFNFDVREQNKLPVAVQLISGPNVLSPVDLAACSGCGHVQFQISPSLGSTAPNVGDSYGFSVTYSDGSVETINGLVTAWGSGSTIVGSSDLATNLAPTGTSSNLTMPTFTWTYPASASSYTYQFQIDDNNNSTLWNIPSQNSNLNGFPSTVAQIVWPTDPTGDSSNTPTVANLTPGTQYQWWITVQDVNGNSATSQVYYIP